MPQADVVAAQTLRSSVINGLQNLVATENANAQTIFSWSTSLAAVTQNPVEISAAAAATSAAVVNSIMAAASVVGESVPSAVISSLLGTVDSLSQVDYLAGRVAMNISSSSTASDSSVATSLSSPSDLMPLVNSLSQQLVRSMVEGQDANAFLYENIRSPCDGSVDQRHDD